MIIASLIVALLGIAAFFTLRGNLTRYAPIGWALFALGILGMMISIAIKQGHL